MRPRVPGFLFSMTLPRPFLLAASLIACAPRLAFHATPRDLGSGAGAEPVCLWLQDADAAGQSGLATEPVDWARDDVVVLSLGSQGTTGNVMQLKSVKLDSTGAVVFDTAHLYPVGAVGEALTHPGLVVRLEKGHAARPRILRIDGEVTNCTWR